MLLYHMSKTLMPDGYIKRGNGHPKVQQEIEDIFELARPMGAISRFDAVFCIDNLDFSTCGVEDDGYIYECACDTEVLRIDNAWIGPLQMALLKPELTKKYQGKSVEYFVAGFPDWSPTVAQDHARRYWAAEESDTPGWEYLCPSITITKRLSIGPVNPKSTRLGWQPEEVSCPLPFASIAASAGAVHDNLDPAC
jgi:hypothetical protein